MLVSIHLHLYSLVHARSHLVCVVRAKYCSYVLMSDTRSQVDGFKRGGRFSEVDGAELGRWTV